MMVSYLELRKNKVFRLKGLIEYNVGERRKIYVLVDQWNLRLFIVKVKNFGVKEQIIYKLV